MQAPQHAEESADAAEDPGFYHRMTDHLAVFHPRGRHLVVSFDAQVASDPEALRAPWGHDYFDTQGQSQLGLVMTRAEDGFANAEVDACFDQLLQHRFFDQFEDVLFLGTGLGGGAALRYAAAVPGCRVVAFAPRMPDALAAPPDAPADAPYADPGAGVAAARKVQLFCDPQLPEDCALARALIGAPADTGARLIRLPGTGHPVPLMLRQPGLLSQVAQAAIDDRIDRARLSVQLRARRNKPSYVRRLLAQAIEAGHWRLVEKALAQVSEAHPEWGFRTVNLMLNRARRQEKRARVRARLERRAAEERDAELGHVSLFERLQLE